MSREVKIGNEWVRVAGRGKAEYGASHYQTGTVHDIAVGANSHTVVEVTMDSAMPDTDYIVTFEHLAATHDQDVFTLWGTATKTTTGFKVAVINTGAADTVSFRWQAFKLYSDKEYDGLLDDVAEMKTVTSGTGTLASGVTGSVKWKRQGKVVGVIIAVTLDSSFVSGSHFCSNLPNSTDTVDGSCCNVNITRLWLDGNSGSLWASGTVANQQIYASLTYIVD